MIIMLPQDLEVANHGFNVDLIEQDDKIGGQLNVVGAFNFDNLDGIYLAGTTHGLKGIDNRFERLCSI